MLTFRDPLRVKADLDRRSKVHHYTPWPVEHVVAHPGMREFLLASYPVEGSVLCLSVQLPFVELDTLDIVPAVGYYDSRDDNKIKPVSFSSVVGEGYIIFFRTKDGDRILYGHHM